jgi:capsular polysaccharide biosynthesis protein
MFLSRRSLALEFPDYRVMQNERNLIRALEAFGFATIEPQNYPIAEQIARFHAARVVVALSGAALFNVVFCKPGTRVVILETDKSNAAAHAALIASLGLEYGVIFGRQAPSDPTPTHKRWRLPVGKSVKAIADFL